MFDNSELQKAITAIRAGDKEAGRSLLAEIIKSDPKNEMAWLWMSGAVEYDDSRRQCLEHVLTINPHNQAAINGLAKLQQEQPSQPIVPSATPETSHSTVESAAIPKSTPVDFWMGFSLTKFLGADDYRPIIGAAIGGLIFLYLFFQLFSPLLLVEDLSLFIVGGLVVFYIVYLVSDYYITENSSRIFRALKLFAICLLISFVVGAFMESIGLAPLLAVYLVFGTSIGWEVAQLSRKSFVKEMATSFNSSSFDLIRDLGWALGVILGGLLGIIFISAILGGLYLLLGPLVMVVLAIGGGVGGLFILTNYLGLDFRELTQTSLIFLAILFGCFLISVFSFGGVAIFVMFINIAGGLILLAIGARTGANVGAAIGEWIGSFVKGDK